MSECRRRAVVMAFILLAHCVQHYEFIPCVVLVVAGIGVLMRRRRRRRRRWWWWRA